MGFVSGAGVAAGLTAAGSVLTGCILWRAVLAEAAAARARRRVAAPGGDAARRLPAPPVWCRARLAEVALPVDDTGAWWAWVAVAVTLPVVVVATAGVAPAVLAELVVALAPTVAWWLLRHRRDLVTEAAVPLVLDAVARSLRSGASLAMALAEAAATAPPMLRDDLILVTAATGRGVAVTAALEEWAARRRLPAIRLAVAALCLGAETGGAQARAVDGVAVTVRQRLGVAGEARALASQARMSAMVIAIAPLGFCVVAGTTDPRVGTFLVGTPLGLVVLGAGLALDAAGALWMGHLTRLR
ncbi:MAG TPA: type II secretion system F family protein [Acidimicrobiales bacterium]|nr:type II secretion system F family protein [Acidimicrobiales bacterium]